MKPLVSQRLPGWSFPFLAEAATGTAHHAMPYLQSYQTWLAPGNQKHKFLCPFGCSIVVRAGFPDGRNDGGGASGDSSSTMGLSQG